MTAIREFANATWVNHCAVFGHRSHEVMRQIKVSEPKRYAQYPVSVSIYFVAPRKRTWRGIWVLPDNISYVTIERDGTVLYDSRSDVPCDMEQWQATKCRMEHERAGWPSPPGDITLDGA